MEEQNEINWPTPQEWAAELRTTKKGQTRNALRTLCNGANCCLGILAEMAGAKPLARTSFTLGDTIVDGYMQTEPRPDWMTDDISLHAAALNDTHRKTFAEIAEATLRNLVELRGQVERLEMVLAMALADRGIVVVVDQ